MAETETENEMEQSGGGGSSARNAALKTAVAAAATGAATYAVRRALSHDSGSNGSNGDGSKGDSKSSGSSSPGVFAAAISSGWEAASEVVVPLAEDAAEAAGKYVAQHGPEVVRERIVPKFIEAFEDAK
jgi:hypothetical protein